MIKESGYASKYIAQGYQMQMGNKKDEILINVKSEIFFTCIIDEGKKNRQV